VSAASDQSPFVFIVDDGELADVRELLAKQGVSYGEAASIEAALASPDCRLLVSNARHAMARTDGTGAGTPAGFRLHVVVYDSVSRTVRRILRQSGCDVAVGRPVHPAVFRLLVDHALYAGPERRQLGRAAMSASVQLKVGRRLREATLVQLSLRGCGLLTGDPLEIDQPVRVVLPQALTGEGDLEFDGHVLAIAAPRTSGDRLRDVAIGFRSLHATRRKQLQGVMDRNALGTTAPLDRTGRARGAPRSGEPAPPPPPAAGAAAGRSGASASERRSGPRKLYSRRVLAAGASGTQMLIGRDLSSGGMRVRPVIGLAVGDEIKLALYGSGDHSGIVVKAVVARDDGWDGLVLRFCDVAGVNAERIAELVDSLPAVRGGKGASGVVVSEILDR